MKQVFIPFTNQETMTCCSCGETKHHTGFRKRKGGVISTSCKLCVNKVYRRDPKVAHLNAVRCRARKAGIPFNLELSDLDVPECCPVLGIKLKGWGENEFTSYRDDSPSIDRLVPSVGYVKGNVNIISNRANLLKKDATLQEIESLHLWMKSMFQ